MSPPTPMPPDTPVPPAEPPDHDGWSEVDVDTKVGVPRRFKVIFHNDDYTTMEFVVDCLMSFFNKSVTEANYIMLAVHKKGSAVAGVYTRYVAETKVANTMAYARENGMPLLLTAEAE